MCIFIAHGHGLIDSNQCSWATGAEYFINWQQRCERMKSAMPPHCDSMDAPVVTAARQALDKENVNLILPYVKESASADVKSAFEKALRARKADPAAREVADLYFFETIVRLHRAGEGAPYTQGSSRQASMSVRSFRWPKRRIETGSPDTLIRLLTDTLRHEVQHRFEHMKHLRSHRPDDVAKAREYVEAMLGLEVYSDQLYQAMKASPHEGGHGHHRG